LLGKTANQEGNSIDGNRTGREDLRQTGTPCSRKGVPDGKGDGAGEKCNNWGKVPRKKEEKHRIESTKGGRVSTKGYSKGLDWAHPESAARRKERENRPRLPELQVR